jgi:hypothetical protein
VKLALSFVLGAFILAVATPSACLADQAGGSTTHTVHTPRPTPRPTPNPELPAPFAPHYTTNPDDCVRHGDGRSQCSGLTVGKAIDVYWSWKCSGKDCAIGGFYLRRAGGGRTGKGKIVGITAARFILQPEPNSGWRGACYVITAYPLSSNGAGESKPSPKICVRQTSKVVTIKADKWRGYTRQYWVLYSDNNPQIKNYPASTNAPLAVGGSFDATNQSQVNNFQRAAYAFDLSSLGGNSVFGGSFAYDRGQYDPANSCAELHRAPSGWASASWIAPTDAPLSGKHNFARSGSTMSWPIDRLVEGWNRWTPFPLFLEEVYGVGPAEFIKSSVVPYSLSCQSYILKPRLILKVGITV